MADQATHIEEGLQRIEFRAMGSQMLAAVESEDPKAGSVLAEVPGWFAGWEQTLSRFKEDSELSRLNGIGGASGPVAVSDTLWKVLQLALQGDQLPYDSYTGDTTHRLFEMWQQSDCNITNATPQNPSGCLNDLYPFVINTYTNQFDPFFGGIDDNGGGNCFGLALW